MNKITQKILIPKEEFDSPEWSANFNGQHAIHEDGVTFKILEHRENGVLCETIPNEDYATIDLSDLKVDE